MESYLNENFGDVKAKNSSEEALQRWRKLCGFVKNRKRRFRFTANLSKRFEAEAIRRSNQEKFRVAVLVSQAALQFINGLSLSSEYTVPEEVEAAGFRICPDELGSIVEGHDIKKFTIHGGAEGIVEKLSTSISDGISTAEQLLNKRKEIYGVNKFTERPARGFWLFVWEALQDMTLMILAVCAVVSLVVGIIMEGWPQGAHDGLGIVASILLVVFVTATRLFSHKLLEGTHWTWSGDDAMEILEYFAVAVTIVVVAVPEGLPLAVTLSLAFAMKKMMNEKALVRNLAACETMGSATSICSDKTGTLTTNHMAVVKACICEEIKEVSNSKETLGSSIPASALKILLQSIFNNTGGEVVKGEGNKTEILGTPTETAILEFGLLLGGDSQAERQASKIVKVEPFNSVKKQMGVVIELPERRYRAH
ncbi:hypothetical protein Patl1_08826 [Pistacia atlantica]|uniref:Uncharacterized protein n=1 Tax=Pistacia atlantica TaxID=434234 RepID=A0ACC1AF56_9ROSI|nr:hypothetical protein Patl1_08826 [Pistacia atlantica]